jgi:hypothetical protein
MRLMQVCGLAFGLAWTAIGFAAEDLASGVKARLASPQVLRGQFEQTKVVSGFKKPLLSSGVFLLWRGHGVLWQTRKPFDSTLTIRRDRLLLSQSDGATVYRVDAGREPGLRAVNELLFALFSGDVTSLQKAFRLEGTLLPKGEWKLVLLPTDSGLSRVFTRVELEGGRYVRQVRLAGSNGDTSLIRFDQLAETPVASAEEAQRLGD